VFIGLFLVALTGIGNAPTTGYGTLPTPYCHMATQQPMHERALLFA